MTRQSLSHQVDLMSQEHLLLVGQEVAGSLRLGRSNEFGARLLVFFRVILGTGCTGYTKSETSDPGTTPPAEKIMIQSRDPYAHKKLTVAYTVCVTVRKEWRRTVSWAHRTSKFRLVKRFLTANTPCDVLGDANGNDTSHQNRNHGLLPDCV